MAPQECANSAAAAFLDFQQLGKDSRRNTYIVAPNEESDVGRQLVQDLLGLHDPTISAHHLRIRCVVYEEDDEGHVIPPMVYVRVISRNGCNLQRYFLEQGPENIHLTQNQQDYLLGDKDVLQLSANVTIRYRAAEQPGKPEDQLDDIRRLEIQRFASQYHVMPRKLGAGGYASVFVALKQSTQQQVACKIVPLPYKRPGAAQRINSTEFEQKLIKKRESLAREYEVLKNLNHPNIITLERVFCTTYNIYIFQELVTGGDLLSYLELKGPLSEPQAAVIVHQVLKAVEYLHNNQIVHRDLKPENILMTSWRDGARIVLTDFGQARTLQDAKTVAKSSVFRMQSIVGTVGYTAP